MSQHPAQSQDHRHPGRPSPIAVQKALGGIDYPTTREKLVETARHHGAGQDVMDLISRLPDRNYDSPASVSKEIARLH
ncbi:DUF2795 domain-containing protein [Paraburkholderia kururiensis]|uniref:DUF2795 domain-containing protein n=1 Tax=Paraburkholderia kururiensis TaxID=984307 RepID=UPI000AAB65DC|nr:DUF2795 domain-containing protein [Paraburkholderia kururiensis]